MNYDDDQGDIVDMQITALQAENAELKLERIDEVRSRHRGVGSPLKILRENRAAGILEVELHPALVAENEALRAELAGLATMRAEDARRQQGRKDGYSDFWIESMIRHERMFPPGRKRA